MIYIIWKQNELLFKDDEIGISRLIKKYKLTHCLINFWSSTFDKWDHGFFKVENNGVLFEIFEPTKEYIKNEQDSSH